jgi:Family of unknown function (DUF6516)
VYGQRDTSLDTLLDLDGQVLVLDKNDGYWVKFEVTRVVATEERPHGLSYSITLHGNDNERLVGFDNAHAVRQSAGPGGKGKAAYDHKHRVRSIRPYEYRDAVTLLADFWTAVDAVLKERGVEL